MDDNGPEEGPDNGEPRDRGVSTMLAAEVRSPSGERRIGEKKGRTSSAAELSRSVLDGVWGA